MKTLKIIIVCSFFIFFFSCLRNNSAQGGNAQALETNFYDLLSTVLINSQLPANMAVEINEGIMENPAFILDLFTILQEDPYLWILVDKEHALDENYEPFDLVELSSGSYRVNRNGLLLRRSAAASLEEMAGAARREGLTLLASSAYRSYGYQAQVYERNVGIMGQQAADRESARPGHSQHQLGLVLDFGSITDAFALTPEGIWLAANASRFGWSLSYPNGYENVTGYRWESWHYRYVGIELAAFIDTYFNGIQQYALRFIYEFKQAIDPIRESAYY